MNFSAVILAGGQSRRMGTDKAWLKRDGKTLLERQIELLQSLRASEVFISGRPDTDYTRFGLPVLRDLAADSGPLGGIERALEAAAQPLLLVLAVDMAEMTLETLSELTSRCGPARGVVPRVNGRVEPLAAVYPKTAWPDAVAILTRGSKSATAFASKCVESGQAHFHDFGQGDAACFKSWNVSEDFSTANDRE